MGERRWVYRVLVGKPEEKRPLGRPRRRWEDNIRMDAHRDQPNNEPKLYTSFFSFTMAPTCFGKTMSSSGSDYVLPKHVGTTVKENKEVYNFGSFSWLVSA
jgi:hypothetical protein